MTHKRLEATHFIEQWREYENECLNTNIQDISELKKTLFKTKEYKFKTIAIWKIKFKNTQV